MNLELLLSTKPFDVRNCKVLIELRNGFLVRIGELKSAGRWQEGLINCGNRHSVLSLTTVIFER